MDNDYLRGVYRGLILAKKISNKDYINNFAKLSIEIDQQLERILEIQEEIANI